MRRLLITSVVVSAAGSLSCKANFPPPEATADTLTAEQRRELCSWYVESVPPQCEKQDSCSMLPSGAPPDCNAAEDRVKTCLDRFDDFAASKVGDIQACAKSLTAQDCNPSNHQECEAFLATATIGKPDTESDDIAARGSSLTVTPPAAQLQQRPATEAAARALREARELPSAADLGCAFGPGALPIETVGAIDDRGEPIPLGEDIPIQYVFVFMLENRSFDHALGRFRDYLQEVVGRDPATDSRLRPFTGPDAPDGIDVPGTPYELLSSADQAAADADFTPTDAAHTQAAWNPITAGEPVTLASDKHYWHRAALNCLSDVNHDWWGAHLQWNVGRMDGFFQSNRDYWEGGSPDVGKVGSPYLSGDRAMSYYDESDLPFYYWLADTFAIGDRYFSSVIGPTFVNRDYLYAATSRGLTSNASQDFAGGPFSAYRYAGDQPASPATGVNTIYDALAKAEVGYTQYVRGRYTIGHVAKWATWYGGTIPGPWQTEKYSFDYDGLLDRGLANYVSAENSALLARIRAGDDPAAIRPQGKLFPINFIDPDVVEDVNGEDEHPPGEPQMGQRLAYWLVSIILGSPEVWKRSAIIIHYD